MKQLKKLMLALLAVALMLAVAACGGGGEKPGPGPDPNPPAGPGVPVVVGEVDTIHFYKQSPQDFAFNVNLKKGTFQNFKLDDRVLTSPTDYTFNVGTEILTIKKECMATLAEGDYKFKFTTNGGSFELDLTVKESATNGYTIEFSENKGNGEAFYAKLTRGAADVTFDFMTLGDFGVEGLSKEFVNIYLDMKDEAGKFEPLGSEGGQIWRLGVDDATIRVYSDGSVVRHDSYDYDGPRANGKENVWWKMDWANKKAVQDNVSKDVSLLDEVVVTKAEGITKFSLKLSYEQLGITKDDEFRFAFKECSDQSDVDFAMYSGHMKVDSHAFGEPAWSDQYMTVAADGSMKPGFNQETDYNLSFAVDAKAEADAFLAKATRTNTAIKFEFVTEHDFSVDEDGTSKEFINIYLDLPNADGALNPDTVQAGNNWCLYQEDFNFRLYSDGTVVYRKEFNGISDNCWWKTDWANALTLPDKVAFTTVAGRTSFSLTIQNSFVNLATGDSSPDIRFALRECSDQSPNDFALYNGNMRVDGKELKDLFRSGNWATMTRTGAISVPAGFVC